MFVRTCVNLLLLKIQSGMLRMSLNILIFCTKDSKKLSIEVTLMTSCFQHRKAPITKGNVEEIKEILQSDYIVYSDVVYMTN